MQRGTKEYSDSDDDDLGFYLIDEVINKNLDNFKSLKTKDRDLGNLIAETIYFLNNMSIDDIKDGLSALDVVFTDLYKKWSAAVGPDTKVSPMSSKLDTVGKALKYISNIQIVLDGVENQVEEVEKKKLKKLRF